MREGEREKEKERRPCSLQRRREAETAVMAEQRGRKGAARRQHRGRAQRRPARPGRAGRQAEGAGGAAFRRRTVGGGGRSVEAAAYGSAAAEARGRFLFFRWGWYFFGGRCGRVDRAIGARARRWQASRGWTADRTVRRGRLWMSSDLSVENGRALFISSGIQQDRR